MLFSDFAGATRLNLKVLARRAASLRYSLPGSPYVTMNDADRQAFAPVLEAWRPENAPPVVLLRWLLTEWCNYRCPYCTQTHDRMAPKGHGMTAHAFDNFPLATWLEAIDRHFADKRLSVVITGGEPFIDRKALTMLVNHLTERAHAECIRIDTNAWWRPDQVPDMCRDKVTLMCTFHPSQVKAEKFFARIDEIQDAGFTIGMVNYVMNADNLKDYRAHKDVLRAKGVPLHPNPLWNAADKYEPEDLALLQEELFEADFRYRSGLASPRGQKCLFPALAYELDYLGRVEVGCHAETQGSFFAKELPRLFAGPVPCPHDSCLCLDKYSFLSDVNRNVALDPLRLYGGMLRSSRRITNS